MQATSKPIAAAPFFCVPMAQLVRLMYGGQLRAVVGGKGIGLLDYHRRSVASVQPDMPAGREHRAHQAILALDRFQRPRIADQDFGPGRRVSVPFAAQGINNADLFDESVRIYDETVAKVMRFKQMQARQTDFLPLPQHRILVISAVLRDSDGLHVFSLGQEQGDEGEIVQRFFDGLERRSPDLVSWNGAGFDLPVLH